jgi:hypothetical protein
MMPVVDSVGNMDRKPVEIPEPPEKPPEPKPVKPTPTKRTIPQTGKTIRGQFLEFFDQYGLDICGYPITEQFEEQGLKSQYFQRLALEELQSGEIQLKLVGTEAWTSRPTIAQLKARLQEFSQLFLAFGPATPPTDTTPGRWLTSARSSSTTPRPARRLRRSGWPSTRYANRKGLASSIILSSPPTGSYTRPTGWRRSRTTLTTGAKAASASASPATLPTPSPQPPSSRQVVSCVPGWSVRYGYPAALSSA